MTGKVFLLIALFLWQFSAHAQWMQEPLRVQDPRYTQFFLEKMNSWFDKNMHSFSKDLSVEEKKLLEIYLKNQKSFGFRGEGYFLRAFSYGVHFSPKLSAASSKVYTLEIFNTEKDEQIQKQILKLAKAVRPQDLAKADILGWRISSDQSRTLLFFKKEAKDAIVEEIQFHQGKQKKSQRLLGVKTADFCLGLMAGEALQKDAQVFEDTNEKRLLCHSIRFEPEAWGPAAEKIAGDFMKGLNLQPGMIEYRPEQASLYFP